MKYDDWSFMCTVSCRLLLHRVIKHLNIIQLSEKQKPCEFGKFFSEFHDYNNNRKQTLQDYKLYNFCPNVVYTESDSLIFLNKLHCSTQLYSLKVIVYCWTIRIFSTRYAKDFLCN